MQESEYVEKLKKLEFDFSQAKKKLYIEFALSQAICGKGDILIDNDTKTIIRVDTITAHKTISDTIIPAYRGFELRKDLKLRKDGNRETIYGAKSSDLSVVVNQVELITKLGDEICSHLRNG